MDTIVLIGMMGCGKTSIGKKLSDIMGCELLDIDKIIVDKEQMTISNIFDTKGENYFREVEKDIIFNICKSKNQIVSLGGGAFENIETQKFLLNNFKVFYLKTSPEVIFNRIKNDKSRPLLKDNMNIETISNILNFRKPNYEKAHYTVVTDDKTPDEICKTILKGVKWDK